MRHDHEQLNTESDAAFAVASILLNLLILLILSGLFWCFYSMLSEPGIFAFLLRENNWR